MNVTFCGHRYIKNPEKISQWLDLILPCLIEGGADTFYLGGYGAFDLLSAEAVKRQKAKYPHIQSILVLPYRNKQYDTSPYDHTFYPSLEAVPQHLAIIYRNEWMVSASDVVISGVQHAKGGAAKTLRCAKYQKKIIFQLPIHSG
ncbi:MAG: hypothetical protein K2O18_18130 [Oscillospiraceae bacterium]|nr:hypothetical protein [Oscillospiraceae bacterium]